MSKDRIFRLLDSPPMSAADNMALDETLVELRGENLTPNTIHFLQFKPRAVLVGFHQAIAEEIRTEYCAEHGIEINRRVTGGGAIFFDENQLGWEVICDKNFFNAPVPNEKLFRTLCDPVVRALDILGVKGAEFRPRNDIEVNGRKISGTGGTQARSAFLFQGTMLVDFDVDTMLRALRIPVEKLKAKEIDSVKERVTCLNWELGYTPSLDEIKSAVRRGFEEALDIELVPGELTKDEQEHFEEHREEFHSEKWVDMVKPKFQKREAVTSSYKSSAGMVRFTLVVNLPQMRLKDVYITGDFLSFPTRALYDLEAELRGKKIDREELVDVIRSHFDESRIEIPGMSLEDFVKPLDQALEKIKITEFGLPLETAERISVANASFAEAVALEPSVLLLPYCAKLQDCELRYERGCKRCHRTDEHITKDGYACSVGPAWDMGLAEKMRVRTVVNYEDLWAELMRMKESGVTAYIGVCCTPFFAKHVDDFKRSGLPGILLDIDDSTCYDLDQAKEAYSGTFESQTTLNLELLQQVLSVIAERSQTPNPRKEDDHERTTAL